MTEPEVVDRPGRWLPLSAAAQALGVSERTLQRRGLRKRPGRGGRMEVFLEDRDSDGQRLPMADTSDTLARFSEGLADALVRRDGLLVELARENERLRARVAELEADATQNVAFATRDVAPTDGGQRRTGWRRWWAWLSDTP